MYGSVSFFGQSLDKRFAFHSKQHELEMAGQFQPFDFS